MKKLILDINNDDDFQLEGVDMSRGIVFTGKTNQECLDKLQKFIEDKIRRIVVLGACSNDGKNIKSWRGQRIITIEECLSNIYRAAGESKVKYNLPAGNWSFSYIIK